MQSKVEKYIYFIKENKYRVKILRYSKDEKKYISVDKYIIGTLDTAREFRDQFLKEHNLALEKEEQNEEILKYNDDFKKQKENKKVSKKSSINNANKVDKYIYEIEKGKKYRVFIRKGSSNIKKGDYFSSTISGNLAAARKIRDIKLAEFKLHKGTDINKSNIKFIDFARLYFREYAEKELSPTTVQKDKRELQNYVLPYIATTLLNKIYVLTVQKLVNKLKERKKKKISENGLQTNLSNTTIDGAYRVLRKILNKAVDWEYLERNPVLKVKSPGPSKVEKESFNREELLKVLDLLSREAPLSETLFTIAICTGLRRGELLGIHLDDIDFEKNEISVNRTVVYDEKNRKIIEKEQKTKESVRIIPVPIFCIDIIKDYLKIRTKIIQRARKINKNFKSLNNLFINQYGNIFFPDTPSNKWIKFQKKHKELKNVSLHGLRHSYCTVQMNENPDLAPADVKKLMGHSQLSTTFIYTHSNEDKKKEAISVFDVYYSANSEKKINFEQIASLYTVFKFVPTNELENLINELVKGDLDINEKKRIIKKEIERKYFYMKELDTKKICINNMCDWIEKNKNKFGNDFVLSINKLG